MWRNLLVVGALLSVPLFSQNADPQIEDGAFVWFTLAETKADLVKQLGPPANVTPFAADYESWQYHLANEDHHEFSHTFVFRRSTGKLISVTRSWEQEQPADLFFPPSETRTHSLPNSPGREWGIRVRELSGGRLLIATGRLQSGAKISQLMLLLHSEMRNFYPSLAK